jgi:TRAP-type C4-dicarboxylate transport system permease small subunit
MLQAFDRRLGQVEVVLSWVACAIIPCMFTLIAADVLIRWHGVTPPLWTSSVVEYGLLYLAMCSAPWLARERGHVVIEALISILSPALRQPLAKIVYLSCGAVSILFAWFSLELFWEAWVTGEEDVRGVDMPYWLLYLPMPLSFLLLGLEFFMYLAGLRHYYSYDLGEVKDGV